MTNAEMATLLASLEDRRSVLRLLRVLGLEAPSARRVRRLPDGCGARVALCVASRGGMDAWLLEGAVSDAARIARAAKVLIAAEPFAQQLLIAAAPGYARLIIGVLNAGDEFRHLHFEPRDVRASDAEAAGEMIAAPGEDGLGLAMRYARALDRERVGRRFFDGLRLHRTRIAAAWTGVPPRAAAARAELALLLICRLLFLYFLQRRGHLAGSPTYLFDQVRRWRAEPAWPGVTFYRGVLRPLFFGALNRKPEQRHRRAAALGALPYLNGGLFERTAVERAHPRVDVCDAAVYPLFEELLERFRFTTADAADGAAAAVPSAGVDPEMLGRVFEGLMAAEQRGATGTFFTPPVTVDGIVRETLVVRLAASAQLPPARVAAALDGDVAGLDAAAGRRLRRAAAALRVLDPACGSGAFLLGMLTRVSRLREHLGEATPGGARRSVVATALHGVDEQADAALLCALRLWLALATEADAVGGVVPPLPNLDRRIRQGDSLVDPLDLGSGHAPDEVVAAAARSAEVRLARRALGPDTRRYTEAPPHERARLARRLRSAEQELARAWFNALHQRYARLVRELRLRAGERDLFGAPTDDAQRAAARVPRVLERLRSVDSWRRRLRRSGDVPFFSYPVHFADAAAAGFDIVVANPPWLRAHRWSSSAARQLRDGYEVCRRDGVHRSVGQLDLSLLFLERSLRLCCDGGVLGFVLPAKLLRSAYAAGARRLLLRETRIARIDDHSLHQRAIFEADAFAVTLVAQRTRPDDGAHVRVRMGRRNAAPVDFTMPASQLSLDPGDAGSPWLITPPAVQRVLRRMQSLGAPLRRDAAVVVSRGIVTGANEVLVVRDATPRLGELVQIRCAGWNRPRAAAGHGSFEALIERRHLRPLLRGSDVTAFRAAPGAHIIWVLDENGSYRPSRRLRRLLDSHAPRLRREGRLQRLSAAALGPKVVWQDIAQRLNACAVAPAIDSPVCGRSCVVPLNTVYYVACEAYDEALLLAATLNALPVRIFAAAFAERAKDARFRFFAGTIAAVPLPPGWRTGALADGVGALSERCHRAGLASAEDALRLDEAVAHAFRLAPAELDTLRTFEDWLHGRGEFVMGAA